jgi:phosphoribosylformimino-5-aminoimidazole carboxamide ribotide isomerase
MKIIPAIDILERRTARSLGETYFPFRSVLTDSPDPVATAQAYRARFKFPEIYIADLDAIDHGREPNWDQFVAIKRTTGCSLRIDAAISDIARAQRTFEAGADRIIIGTETLLTTDFIRVALQAFGPERLIVSLDLKGKHLLSACRKLDGGDPVVFAGQLETLGVREIMVLDLPRAGTGIGVNVEVVEDIVAQLRRSFSLVEAIVRATSMDVLAGSGLGRIEEIKVLQAMGVSAVTIARTLHEGEITPDILLGLSRFGSCGEV